MALGGGGEQEMGALAPSWSEMTTCGGGGSGGASGASGASDTAAAAWAATRSACGLQEVGQAEGLVPASTSSRGVEVWRQLRNMHGQ